MTVAVIGASNDRHKFGNKSVRAHVAQGYTVFPVNTREKEIEGLPVYKTVLDVPHELDRVSVYLSPDVTLMVLEEIAKKGTKELFLNPGSESPEVVAKAKALGLEPILACSIVAIGDSPANYS